MMPYWILLVPYCAAAFGIHGGELVTGVNRQLRNLICALPFGLVSWFVFSHLPLELRSSLVLFFGAAAYLGANMGFDNHPLWLKGLVTFPPLGAILLPLAYSMETTASNQEYLSGFFYGVALCFIVISL